MPPLSVSPSRCSFHFIPPLLRDSLSRFALRFSSDAPLSYHECTGLVPSYSVFPVAVRLPTLVATVPGRSVLSLGWLPSQLSILLLFRCWCSFDLLLFASIALCKYSSPLLAIDLFVCSMPVLLFAFLATLPTFFVTFVSVSFKSGIASFTLLFSSAFCSSRCLRLLASTAAAVMFAAVRCRRARCCNFS